MADNILNSNFSDGDTVLANHVKQLITALNNDIVGRNNNAPAAGQRLGTPVLPFAVAFINQLVANGKVLDLSLVSASPNRIISARTSAQSSLPKFIGLDPAGSLSFQLLGATTALVLDINGSNVTINEDLMVGPFSAGPSADHQMTADDGDLNNAWGQFAGETDLVYASESGIIEFDAVGSEIIALAGKRAAFQNGDEILVGDISPDVEANSCQLRNVYRAWGFGEDDAIRGGDEGTDLDDDTVITLLKTIYLFIDTENSNDPQHIQNISTDKAPAYGPTAPDGATGQYWFNTVLGRWTVWDGSQFIPTSRLPIAEIYLNDTACIGYRCYDLSRTFDNANSTEWERTGDNDYIMRKHDGRVSVYGTLVNIPSGALTGNNGVRASSGNFLYLDEVGHFLWSPSKPMYRPALGGFYHRGEAWRCVAHALADASSDFDNGRINNNAHFTTYFPWQRYSPQGKTPTSFSMRINSNSTYSGGSPFSRTLYGSASDPGGAEIRFNFRANFLTSTPVGTAERLENFAGVRIAYIRVLSTTEMRLYTNQSVSALVEVTLAGPQGDQVYLDNTLKAA